MTNHIIIGEPFESEDVRTFYLLPRNFLAKADFFDFLKCAQSEPHSTTAKRCGKNPNKMGWYLLRIRYVVYRYNVPLHISALESSDAHVRDTISVLFSFFMAMAHLHHILV